MDLCNEYLAKWSVPREIEIREELPTTLIGKVDWLKLKDEIELNYKIGDLLTFLLSQSKSEVLFVIGPEDLYHILYNTP